MLKSALGGFLRCTLRLFVREKAATGEDSEMEHECDLASRIGTLLFDESTSDMAFIVEGEKVFAHRLILTTASDYFRALLGGCMRESREKEITMNNVSLHAFKTLMGYIYTGQLKLLERSESELLELLGVADMYGLSRMTSSLSRFLGARLTFANVFKICEQADSLNLKDLVLLCKHFLLEDPVASLNDPNFFSLPRAALLDTLSDDEFCAEEIDIWNGIINWRNTLPPEKDISDVLEVIRLPLISTAELMSTVRDSGLFPLARILDAVRMRACHPRDMSLRASIRKGINLATADLGAKELRSGSKNGQGVIKNGVPYTTEMIGSVLHVHERLGLIIVLGRPYVINTIEFEPTNESERDFRGFTHVSTDLINWYEVGTFGTNEIDGYHRFEPRVVLYIKISQRHSLSMDIRSLSVSYMVPPSC